MDKSITLNFKVVDNKKSKAKSSLIIELLKRRGIAGSQALRMFQAYGSEYLVRKNFLLDYYKNKGSYIHDDRRWIQAAIVNDYSESDDFINWLKRKKDDIIQNGGDDIKQLISI